MSKIRKISNLDNIEGFLQVDYFKGNKYIDKAGEFMNHLYDSKEGAPKSHMSPMGAEFTFEGGKRRIEVNAIKLWTGYVAPDSLEMQKAFFTKTFNSAVSLFEPASYGRVGWRNHFVSEDDVENTKFFNNNNWYGGDFRELSLKKDFGDIKASIRISKVLNSETQKSGLLFDLDLYKEFDEEKDSAVIVRTIIKISEKFNSEDVLGLVNDFLKNE